MRVLFCVIGSAFGALAACTQPGDGLVRPAGAPQACSAGEPCSAPGYERTTVPVQPVVPAVPASPLKADCAELPTQLERDTCINRKASTV